MQSEDQLQSANLTLFFRRSLTFSKKWIDHNNIYIYKSTLILQLKEHQKSWKESNWQRKKYNQNQCAFVYTFTSRKTETLTYTYKEREERIGYLLQRSRWGLAWTERQRRSISAQRERTWEISFLTTKDSSGESNPPLEVEFSSRSSLSIPSCALISNFFALWYISDSVPPPPSIAVLRFRYPTEGGFLSLIKER